MSAPDASFLELVDAMEAVKALRDFADANPMIDFTVNAPHGVRVLPVNCVHETLYGAFVRAWKRRGYNPFLHRGRICTLDFSSHSLRFTPAADSKDL